MRDLFISFLSPLTMFSSCSSSLATLSLLIDMPLIQLWCWSTRSSHWQVPLVPFFLNKLTSLSPTHDLTLSASLASLASRFVATFIPSQQSHKEKEEWNNSTVYTDIDSTPQWGSGTKKEWNEKSQLCQLTWLKILTCNHKNEI